MVRRVSRHGVDLSKVIALTLRPRIYLRESYGHGENRLDDVWSVAVGVWIDRRARRTSEPVIDTTAKNKGSTSDFASLAAWRGDRAQILTTPFPADSNTLIICWTGRDFEPGHAVRLAVTGGDISFRGGLAGMPVTIFVDALGPLQLPVVG
jgi:hypothetical protein